MCGFCGIYHATAGPGVNQKILGRMNDALFHRGPDEGGFYRDEQVGLGHRRLSIIDISAGQQPLFNEKKDVVVVYNGEIYNFAEIASRLQEAGHHFRTHCDTEVIVHAWEEWGVECLQHFRGMFAFALWDKRKQQLFMARDRLGIKPLFYALCQDRSIIFGSELKALRQHPGCPNDMEPTAIEDYFSFGYIPDPKTIHKNIWKLEPGHYLLLQEEQTEPAPVRYWDVQFHDTMSHEQDVSRELITRLTEAIDIRLMAEVPLGAFLSGGIDSSAIVALMSGLLKNPVNTYSISFDDQKFNESDYARQVAEQYRTNHRQKCVTTNDFELIDQLMELYDEPYADSSAMPTYRVCELAKEKVTVVLSGDGGDENLGGYHRYRWFMNEERMRSTLPFSFRRPVFGLLGQLYPKLDWMPRIFRAKSTFQSLAKDQLSAYFNLISPLLNDLRQQLYQPSFVRELQGYNGIEVFRRHIADAPTDHPLSLIQYLDLKTYLPGDILTKVDRASMAHSLEVRVPLLDHKLVEWMASIHPNLKLRGQEGKYIFKKSLSSHLSNDILYRRKMGFAVPLAAWFRGPLKERVNKAILADRLQETGLFRQQFMEDLLTQHQSGKRDHSVILWSLLLFNQFIQAQY